ncbi:hypothetical protein TRIATDRAFT_79208 [Trichoderma atroviride IMI 206040]|uniref:Uncharacterized protein n=1 Tax=Hypocrea atroviridis (strain ATCC 20476 / IMI 206040) TaxID=452589 RepID=G9NZX6_HYPAI|nr:uncharacterized protein TRIATDRAFT_79208 [Trichoderma atroviride IMI 206040]EHK44023.1 hypothetical protein TRIATDRAFT_79208 [Trichoderma atroviride IMI 206040]
MASTTIKFTVPSSISRTALRYSAASQITTNHYKVERNVLLSNITPYDPRAIVRVLIPISIAGWLLFGVICILCINGRGKLGRWIPEWYLDSEGTRGDKAMVVLWWVVVVVFWPLILPVLFVRGVVCLVKRWTGGREAQLLWPRKSLEEV